MLYDTTKVTVELGEILDAGVKVFDFDYPSFYQGDAKTAFEQKVLDHYRFRQIGQETVGRWLHQFRTRVREIMPYYIQLYESEILMKNVGDPFEAYNLTETFTRKVQGTEQGTESHTTTGKATTTGSHNETNAKTEAETIDVETGNVKKFSNTPQGSIDNLNNYLTEATIDDGTNKTDRDLSGNETVTGEAENETTTTDNVEGETARSSEQDETYTLTRKGNIGVQPLGQEIKAYRDALINIDLMVIRELNDLFLGVY